MEINERATLYGIIFDEAKLSSYVAKEKIRSEYDGAPVNLILDDNAAVSISSNSKAKIWESDSLNLSLKGGANIVWIYNNVLLQKSLAGQRKSSLNSILSSFQGITEMRAEVRPYWKRSFPNKPEKIKIENFMLKK